MADYDFISPIFEQSVPIVFGADENFFIPLIVCIQSIVANASINEYYDIVILVDKFNIKYTSLLQSMEDGRNNISIRVYDMVPFLEGWDMSRLKTGHRLSLAAYYRLFIPELMKDYHKVIYIDGDTVILKDIVDLYHHNIEDVYVGAVRDYNIIRDMSISFRHHVQQTLQMDNADEYFNSGVLVMNLDMIRRDFSLPFLMEQAELKGRKHHDQDVLNCLFYGRVCFLPPKYNSMWQNEELYTSVENGIEAIYHPVIIHYTGSCKPWMKCGVFKGASALFWKYAVTCPYAEEIKNICKVDCKKNIVNYHKELCRYFWYLFLSKILFGRKLRHYKEKVHATYVSLDEIRMLKEMGEACFPWNKVKDMV